MPMLAFLLNGQRRESPEPRCCRLEDRPEKASKRLTEDVALLVPRKLRHQGERNWRNWCGNDKISAVQLVKTAGYNHLRLKHGKDAPPKVKVYGCRQQLQEAEEHQPLRRQGRPQTLTAMEEAAVVK